MQCQLRLGLDPSYTPSLVCIVRGLFNRTACLSCRIRICSVLRLSHAEHKSGTSTYAVCREDCCRNDSLDPSAGLTISLHRQHSRTDVPRPTRHLAAADSVRHARYSVYDTHMRHRLENGILHFVRVLLRIVRVHAHDKVVPDAVPRSSVIQCRVCEAVTQLSCGTRLECE